MKRVAGVLGVVLFGVLFASRASAQESRDAGPKTEAPERRWYGYQTLAADGIAITMTSLGVQSGIHQTSSEGERRLATPAVLLLGGLSTYLFAAPTIHALHGHWGKAGGSFALRSAPLVVCAGLLSGGGEEAGALGGGALLVGVLTALIVDNAVVANEDVPATSAPPRASVAPTFDPKSKAAGVAFAATF